MVLYIVKRKNNKITNISAEGHALFDEYGKDIVCASVSTALIMTANAIETLGLKLNIKTKVKDGSFEISVIKNNDIIEGLLINLEYTLNELEKQYHSHIKGKKEE